MTAGYLVSQHTCITFLVNCSTFSWTVSAHKFYVLLSNWFEFGSYHFEHKNYN